MSPAVPLKAFLAREWQAMGERRLVALVWLLLPLAAAVAPLVVPGGGGAADPLAPLRQGSALLVVAALAAGLAAGSQAIVRERGDGTLAPLLALPLGDLTLLAARLAALALPLVAATWGAAIVAALVADLWLYRALGGLAVPDGPWLLVTFVIAPLAVLLGLLAGLVVSARAASPASAAALTTLLALPVLALLLWLALAPARQSPPLLLATAAALAALDLLLVTLAAWNLDRDRLVGG